MTGLLLIRTDEMPFDVEAVADILSTHSGFQEVRFDSLIGAVVEARDAESEAWTIVGLKEDRETISLSGTSDAALREALILQASLRIPLRMFDTYYTFDVVFEGLSPVDELKDAISTERRPGELKYL